MAQGRHWLVDHSLLLPVANPAAVYRGEGAFFDFIHTYTHTHIYIYTYSNKLAVGFNCVF